VRKAYRGVVEPNPDVRSLPGADSAARLKKNLGMLRALEAFAEEQTTRARAWLVERLAPYRVPQLIERFDAMTVPVARRFAALKSLATRERSAASGIAQTRWENVVKVLKQGVDRITKYKEELLTVLTDEALLARHLPEATPRELAELAAFQRALQGQGGSDRRPGPKVSFDDLALLLRLIQIKNGGVPDAANDDDVSVYDHVMIDEVQDFGAIELRVLFGAVRSRTGITVVGDHNQKIVPASDFIGWDALAAELGLSGAAVTKLTVSHRSSRAILALARTLEEEPADGEVEGRDGPTPRLVETDSTAALREALVAELKQALAEAPQGHHCVVCRWPRQAQELCEWLNAEKALPGTSVRVGHNNQFAFEPGVTVTNTQQVKGLEFDSVAVIDPTEAHYPADPQGRRNLYTVITRARDRLTLLTAYPATGLLRPAIEGGVLLHELVGSLAPVTFTEADDEPF
jgi:DNA helicase IV